MKKNHNHINAADSNNRAATRIPLTGDLTVNHVTEIKSILVAAMQNNTSLQVILNDITSIDLAGIQLLISLRETSGSEQRPVAFEIKLPPDMEALITKAGLMHNLVEKKN